MLFRSSTEPSARLRAHPVTSSSRAALCANARYPTPCTLPEIRKRRALNSAIRVIVGDSGYLACYDSAKVQALTATGHFQTIHVAPGIGLIFDLDGVIVNSMPVHKQAWERYLHSLGFPAGDIASRMLGRSNDDIVREFLGPAAAAAEVARGPTR